MAATTPLPLRQHDTAPGQGHGESRAQSQGAGMDHDQLDLELKHAPSVKLLKSDTAPLIAGFLYRLFKREQRVSVPYGEVVEHLTTYLEALAERHPGRYGATPQAYLKQWSDEEHRYLRVYVRGGDDEPQVELTPEAERAIGWLEELRQRTFIGTESRFLHIFDLLEEIATQSTEDAEARLVRLEKQKESLQREIDAIRDGGAIARYTDTQLKERFFEASDVARQLLRDFAAVEQNFRGVARSVQEAQLRPEVRKGTLVGYVLDADAELKASDQGRSFYAFWDFLLSPSKQDELQALLDAVYALPALRAITGGSPLLRRITKHLIDAGERIVRSNHRLAEQLRRILDERTLAEGRRVRELIADIKHVAIVVGDTIPSDATPVVLEGPPEVRLVMEKGLWEPAETRAYGAQPLGAAEISLGAADLERLYTQFAIDESLLRRRIDTLLEGQPHVTLAGVLEHYPLEHGLAEVVTYLAIASREPRHRIDDVITEQIALPAVDGGDTAADDLLLTLPQVTYRRSGHAH